MIPSKTNNQFNIDFAYPGLCSMCHVEIAEFDGSHEVRLGNFRPRIARWLPNQRRIAVRLDDGTIMGVNVCTECKESFKPEDADYLMKSEIHGWDADVEISTLPDSKKRNYMDEYVKRRIVDYEDSPWTDSEKTRIKPIKDKDLKLKERKG